jgi:hypothetical protein
MSCSTLYDYAPHYETELENLLIFEIFFVNVDVLVTIQLQQQQHSLLSQASWGRLILFINNVGKLGDRILVPWRWDTHLFNSK